MLSLEKIKKYIPNDIINTINLLSKEGNKEILTNWLKDCKIEIEFRHEQKISINFLYYEKAYLEYILSY